MKTAGDRILQDIISNPPRQLPPPGSQKGPPMVDFSPVCTDEPCWPLVKDFEAFCKDRDDWQPFYMLRWLRLQNRWPIKIINGHYHITLVYHSNVHYVTVVPGLNERRYWLLPFNENYNWGTPFIRSARLYNLFQELSVEFPDHPGVTFLPGSPHKEGGQEG